MSDSNAQKVDPCSSESEDDSLQEETEEQLHRKKIRENLSTMSFEELLELKEKVGSKVYNNAIYGSSRSKTPKQPPIVKGETRHGPMEISSKIRPQRIKAILSKSSSKPIKQHAPRDPRFDPSVGEFDKSTFKENYKFVNDLRQKEKIQLEKEYSECTDPERKKTIKLLIQRIVNQLREEDKTSRAKDKEVLEKKEIRDKVKRGEKPLYKSKSVKRIESLVEKYEELKKTNKLQKHIRKRTKKLQVKDRKNMGNIKQ